jgi:hypothetical protein
MAPPVMRYHCFKTKTIIPSSNELGIYILDKFSMFQNMQDYAVTADNDIDN